MNRFGRWLRQNRMVRVLAVYIGASWAILEVTDVFIDKLGLPAWFFPAAILLLLIGLAVVVSTALAESGAPTAEPAPRAEPLAKEIIAGRLPTLTWPRAILGGVLAFGALAAVGTALVLLKSEGAPPIAAEAAANAVAVLPFRTAGAELEVWREGLMDVLSANLDDVGDLRSLDSRAVLSRWKSRIGDADGTAAEAVAVARELGAGWALRGQAVELGGQVRLDAALHDVETAEVVASATVAGAPDSILDLIDNLTLQLLRGLGEEEGMGAGGSAFTAASLEAVKPFLEGEQAMRRSEFGLAIELFERALEIDSTFAMAAHRLASAYGWQARAGDPAAIAASEQARRFADHLPVRDRGLLEASDLLEQGRSESLDVARRLVARYPDDPEAWNTLGEAIYHLGQFVGMAYPQSVEPFERALALDSSFMAPLIHLIELTSWYDDMESFDRYSRLYLEFDSTSEQGQATLIAHRLLTTGGADSLAAWELIGTLSMRSLRGLASIVWSDPDRNRIVERAIEDMLAPRHTIEDRGFGLWWWLNLYEAWRGRPASAALALDEAESLLGPDDEAVRYFKIAAYLYGRGDPEPAARALERAALDGWLGDPRWRQLLAHYRLRQGQAGAALAEADTIEQLALGLRTAGDSLEALIAEGLALGMRGRVAAERGEHRQAVSLLRRSVPLASGYGDHGELRFALLDQQLVMAGSLAELGEEEEAIRILEATGAWPFTDVPSTLAQAQLYEKRGEREQAIKAYSRVVRVWEECDPELRPTWEAAQRALERLVSES